MTPCSLTVAEVNPPLSAPRLGEGADNLMQALAGLSVGELAEGVKISNAMAVRLREMILGFPDKRMGEAAINAFTGVVFKALSPATLPPQALESADRRLRIVSSLYGLLRPRDAVKAYRLDFTTPLAPGGETFAAYWRGEVTRLLLDDLRSTGSRDVIDLLPADAAREIDWKEVGKVARIWKIDFRQVDGAKVKTPHAARLKTLRGLLLRQILVEEADTPEAVASLESPHYYCDSPPSGS